MHLPQDLIVEILLRLPVKSLLRFKCICKSWFSLISDPSFTTSHFELAAARTERLLIVPINSGIQSIDFNASLHDDSATASVNNKFFNLRYYHSNVEIKGSCQGFILLDLEHAFCIWNPSTGIHKIVDWSPMLYDSGGIFSFLGLGYDSSTDDYLIFLMSNHDVHDVNASRAEVFSFRANAWKEIEATYSGDSVNKEAGLFFNGSIHWFAFNDDILKHVIVAFDCTERRFSEMHLPVDLDFHNFNFHKLRVLRESLNVCAVRRIQLSTEIWMMKKYKVQLSWTKIMSVSLNDIHGGFFLLLCYTRSGDLVGENYYGRVVKYNDKGHLQERGSYCDEPWRSMVVYTESLLSLP